MRLSFRSILVIVVTSIVSENSLSQDNTWTLKLSDQTSVESLKLVAVNTDSVWTLKDNMLLSFPLTNLVQIRSVHASNLTTSAIIGGLGGLVIGRFAYASDAANGTTPSNSAKYYGEGVLIGAAAGGLIGWMINHDEVYTLDIESRVGKSIILKSILDDQEQKSANARAQDSLDAFRTRNPNPYWITFDRGTGGLAHSSFGWETQYSLRAGMGMDISPAFSWCFHLDYDVDKIAGDEMSYGFSPGTAKRYDLAGYAGSIFFKILEVGVGAFYSRSDKVIEYYAFQPVGKWGRSGSSTIHLLFVAGIGYQLQFLDHVILPFGFYVRNNTYDDANGSTTVFRIGLGYKF